jgi:hypothetical protein
MLRPTRAAIVQNCAEFCRACPTGERAPLTSTATQHCMPHHTAGRLGVPPHSCEAPATHAARSSPPAPLAIACKDEAHCANLTMRLCNAQVKLWRAMRSEMMLRTVLAQPYIDW